jgi:molecular chaperone HtpG
MEELMRRMGQDVPKQKRTLELNAAHPLVQRLQAQQASGGDQERVKRQVRVLRDQAILAEGGRLADPAAFAKAVQELMLGVLGEPPKSASATG